MRTLRVLFFTTFLVATAFAAPQVWTGKIAESFEGGSGTESDPYLVATAEQFAHMAFSSDTAIFYKLTEDIVLNEGDASEWAENPPANQWTVYGTTTTPVHKYIDGNSHKVSGLYINSTDSLQGLFGAFIGLITDLSLENGYVKGGRFTGGLVGLHYCADRKKYYAACGLFRDTVDLYVEGDNYVGGIAGSIGAIDDAHIQMLSLPALSDRTVYEDLVFKGSVTGNLYVGGIAALYCTCMYLNKAYNLFNYGTVTGKGNVGGIIGKNGIDVPHGTMQQSFKNYGPVKGDTTVGGIVGLLKIDRLDTTNRIEYTTHGEWINFGNVSGNSKVAGIVATIANGRGDFTLRHSYNVGTVSALDSVGGIYAKYDKGHWASTYSRPEEELVYTCLNFGEVIKNDVTLEEKKSIEEANSMLSPTRYSFIADESGKGENQGYPLYIPKHKDLIIPNGSGTLEDPYIISNERELYGLEIMNSLDSNYIRTDTLYFMQTADIEWTGKYGEWNIDSLRLTEYNGGNHSISGIKIKHPERDSIGFVRYFTFSTIANLTLKDFEIEGHNYVGGIAGYGSRGYIHNVRIEGSVKGNNVVGGIAGRSSIALTDVVSNADVSGKNRVGGFNGECSARISFSVSNANVEGDSLVGGFCGVTKSEQTEFYNVYSIANVKAKTNGSMVANSADEKIKGATKLFYKKSDFENYDRGGTALDDSFMKSDAFLDSLPLTFMKDTAAKSKGYPIPHSFKGLGSADSPYLIENEKDLYLFNKRNTRDDYDVDWTSKAFFKLTADIDMKQNKEYLWPPITQFNGVLDGDFHAISNMNVNNTTAAFFSKFYGSVKNLGIRNSTFKGHRAAAFAYQFNGQMKNCWNENTSVTAGQNASGLVGIIEVTPKSTKGRFGKVSIDRVYNTGTIKSDSAAGAAFVSIFSISDNLEQLDTSRYIVTNAYNRGTTTLKGFASGSQNFPFGSIIVKNLNSIKFKFATNLYNTQSVGCNGDATSSYTITNNSYSLFSQDCYDDFTTNYKLRDDVKKAEYMKTAEFVELLGDAFEMDTDNVNDGFPILKGLKPRTDYKDDDTSTINRRIANMDNRGLPALRAAAVGRDLLINGIEPGTTLKIYDITGALLHTVYATNERMTLRLNRAGLFIVRNQGRVRSIKVK